METSSKIFSLSFKEFFIFDIQIRKRIFAFGTMRNMTFGFIKTASINNCINKRHSQTVFFKSTVTPFLR